MSHPPVAVLMSGGPRCSRRVVVRAVGASALIGLAGVSARPVHAQTPSAGSPTPVPLPGTPLGDQFTWVLAQMNGGAATLTPTVVITHFAPSLLAGLPPADAILALKQLAALGPFSFRGFPETPTATSAAALLAVPTVKIYRLSLTIEASAPSRLTSLLLSPVPEVAYAATALGDPANASGLSAAIFMNDAGRIATTALSFGEGGGRAVAWRNGSFTDLMGPNGETISQPAGIDATGGIVASWIAPSQDRHGCLWRAEQFLDLPPLPGGDTTVAAASNASGVVVGSSSTRPSAGFRAVRWVGGQPQALGQPDGVGFSEARVVNSAGQIAGYAVLSTGETRALLWDGAQTIDLGNVAGGGLYPGTVPGSDRFSPLVSLNDLGQVAWTGVTASGDWHPFRWANGAAADLGALPGGRIAVATGLSGGGQVIGRAENADLKNRPFLWEDGSIVDLGVLPGGNHGGAVAIGGSGRIAGWAQAADGRRHAVLWGGWGLTDLGPLPGDTESEAIAVNDIGQAAGWSYDVDGVAHGVLWLPVLS